MTKTARRVKAVGTKKTAQGTEKRLSLDKIERDHDVQPRVATDTSVVADYAERIEAGDKFPPVDVFFDGEKHWLSVGFHRAAAHKKAGRKQIDCIVHQGTKDDAKWHALQSNKSHGLHRSNEDKVRAVKMAFEHPKGKDLSSRQIAELVGVSPTMVEKYRPKPEPTAKDGQSRPRIGRDGRKIKTAKIGTGKKGNGKTAKAKPSGKPPTPHADHGVEEPAEVAPDVAKDRLVEGVLHGKPLEVYRRVLEELPNSLAALAKQVDDIAGKAMEPKAARKALVRISKSIKVFFEAETKRAEAKESK